MDGLGDYHTKRSQSDRGRQISYDYHLNVEPKKMILMNLSAKQEQTHRLKRMNLWLLEGGRSRRGTDWEFGTDMYMLLYLKQITKKDLL